MSSIWVADERGNLTEHETGTASTVRTVWPPLDSIGRLAVSRAADWALEHAAQGRLDEAYRYFAPGSRRQGLPPNPELYWWRQLHLGSLGASVSMYLGSGTADSRAGLIVNDADDVALTGWERRPTQNGRGPGRGEEGRWRFNQNDAGGGGGGCATRGVRGGGAFGGGSGGPITPALNVMNAIIANSFTADNLGLAGSGGCGWSSHASTFSGASGDLEVRVSSGNLELPALTRNGDDGDDANTAFEEGGQGGGSGGAIIGIAGRGITLASGATLRASGGAGGAGQTNGTNGGAGGNGWVILFSYFSSPITGSNLGTGTELAKYRLLPTVPFGAPRIF